jgi:hypothetical protein
MEEGCLQIPRKQYEEYVIKEASSSNVVDKAFGRELFKLFLQSPERIKTRILLNPPPTTITPMMNLPPIMVVPPLMLYTYNTLNIMIMKIQFYTFDN